MKTLMQLDYNELREVVKDCFKEVIIEMKEQPALPELPDMIGPEEVMEITGRKKSWLYKQTMTGGIPCKKFGKRLVFSRKQLLEWMESHTITKTNPEITAATNLAKEARKKL